MPKPHTVYKKGQRQPNVYPSELNYWLSQGWSLSPTPPSVRVPEDEEIVPLMINSVTAEQISERLDGIGPSRASKIIAKRESLGCFTDASQIPFIDDDHKSLINLTIENGGED